MKTLTLAELRIHIRDQNGKGIRNVSALRHICLVCGSNDVSLKNPKKSPNVYKCFACQEVEVYTTWYVNHCWNASCSGLIDSRDSDHEQCALCRGYKCVNCGVCHKGCKNCPSIEAARDDADDIPHTITILHSREEDDELRSSAREYGYDLDDDLSYDEDMGMFYDGDNWLPV